MTSIRKQILVSGNAHFVEVNSSLDLEEVEITGTDPASGKTVHISLSSLLKTPRYPEPSPYNPQPLGMGSPGPSYGSPSASPGSLMDLNMPSPSALSASMGAPSSPPAMDMFSDPLPAITNQAANYAPSAMITPPLSSEVSIVPAPTPPESGLAGLAGISNELAVSSAQNSALQEVIQAREPQGLEALDDPLPSMMESQSDEVTVETPVRHLTPSLRKSEKEELDDHLDSMYKPK